jgi:hypothetical protein
LQDYFSNILKKLKGLKAQSKQSDIYFWKEGFQWNHGHISEADGCVKIQMSDYNLSCIFSLWCVQEGTMLLGDVYIISTVWSIWRLCKAVWNSWIHTNQTQY